MAISSKSGWSEGSKKSTTGPDPVEGEVGPGATVSVTVGFHPAEAGAHMCDATLFYFEVAGDPWMPRPRAILAEVVGLTGLSGRSSVTFREIFAVGQEGVILRPDNHF